MKTGRLVRIIACALFLNQSVNAQDIAGNANIMIIVDGKLVIGGSFEKSDRRIVNNITTWDGTKFAGLGKGIDGHCRGLAADGKIIYAAGDFSYVNKTADGTGDVASNRIAKWDGTKWVSLGAETVDREVFCAAAKDGKLYIGGNFTKVGGSIPTRSAAVHDGKSWSGLGDAKFDRAITSMTFHGKDLYCGGIFTINGDEPIERFAKWDGKAWSEPVRGGLNGIETMVSDGKNLYLGGKFGLKMFDGTNLIEIPGSPKSMVTGIFVDGTNVYIAGQFSTILVGKKEVPTGGIAMWDGTKWTAYPTVPYTTMKCVAMYNGVLYAGGAFETQVFFGITKLVNGAWTKVGP